MTLDDHNIDPSGSSQSLVVDRREYSGDAVDGISVFEVQYTAPYLRMYVNGYLIPATDYTATNGTSVTLIAPLSKADYITLIGYASFTATDTYTQFQVNSLIDALKIHQAIEKTTPVDTDELGVSDSADGWSLKRLTFANLKNWISTFFVSRTNAQIDGNLNINGVGRRIVGDFSNSVAANRIMFQSNVPNGITSIAYLPNGTATDTYHVLYSGTDVDNATGLLLRSSITESQINSFKTGTGVFTPTVFYTGGTARLRIETTGAILSTNSGGIGYGVGSGGAVVQPTNKSTAVTLNKPSGEITLSGAALAANATVAFTFVNSTIEVNDTLMVQIKSGAAAFTSYRLNIGNATVAGQRGIAITNQSASSLSEAIVLQFNVLKGSTT